MTLIAKEREVVVPGEVIAKGMEYLPSTGTYRHKEEILANQLGLLVVDNKVVKTIPLSGRYLPKRNDVVIGKVIDIMMSGWRFEINSPYSAMLPLKEAGYNYIARNANLSKIYGLEDYVVMKIIQVTSQNLIDLSCKGPGLKKLKGGQMLRVSPSKVPRIIGKKGSMVSMLKKATDCRIVVGQNGIVWISGDPKMELRCIEAIRKIEAESHKRGLTGIIKEYLEKVSGRSLDENSDDSNSENQDSTNSQAGDQDD